MDIPWLHDGFPLTSIEFRRVRVANELGAGNGQGAKFATKVSVVQSTIIGIIFFALIMIFHNKFAYIFTSSDDVLEEVDELSLLLGVTILLNSVQPILSGVSSSQLSLVGATSVIIVPSFTSVGNEMHVRQYFNLLPNYSDRELAKLRC